MKAFIFQTSMRGGKEHMKKNTIQIIIGAVREFDSLNRINLLQTA